MQPNNENPEQAMPAEAEQKPIVGEQTDLFPAGEMEERPAEAQEGGFDSAKAEQQDLFDWGPEQRRTPGQMLDSGIDYAKSKMRSIGDRFSSFWNSARNRAEDTVATADNALNNAVGAGAERLQRVDDAIGAGFEAAKNGAVSFFESNFTAEGRLRKFAEKLGLREENIPALDSPEARQSILGLEHEDGLAMGETIAGKSIFGAIQRYRQRVKAIEASFAQQEQADADEAETAASLEKAAAMNEMAGKIDVAKESGVLKASSYEEAAKILEYGERLGLITRNELKLEIDRRRPPAESPEQALRAAA